MRDGDRRGGMSGCLRRPDERSFYGNGETEADELGEGIVRRDVSGCCGRGLGGELPEEGAEWGETGDDPKSEGVAAMVEEVAKDGHQQSGGAGPGGDSG